MTKTARALAGLALLGASAAPQAGLLDELSAIDINDYAIGLGVSYGDSVYVGDEASSWVYPFVTKFSPADFDNGVLFSRARGYGVRWLADAGWEVGALARMQTLGFGANASQKLDGLEDRGWTVEIAPTLGWRRWPVNIDWTAFVDLFGNHSGTNQLLRFSKSWVFQRGYVTPELGLNYYSSSYVDYYFGVPAPASRADRATYAGTSADGPSLGVAWGYRVKPKWLVTGKYTVEHLGAGITESPIVDTSERRSLSLQFTYDGTLFDELAEPTFANGRTWATLLSLTLADVHADTTIEAPLDDPDGPAGDFSADATLVNFDARVTLGGRHRIDIGLFRALHERSEVSAESELTARDLQVAYGFDLIRDAQKEVTLLAGLHLNELTVTLDGGSGERNARSTVPLPVLGVAATARFAGKLSAQADLRWFMLDADRYSGNQVFAKIALMHHTFEHAELGIGYVLNRLSIDSDEGDFGGHIKSSYGGPSLVLVGSF